MTDNNGNIGDERLDKILDVLKDAPDGMNADSIVAVLVLTESIEAERSLIDLLKEGKIKAQYTGDKNGDVDPNLFVFSRVDGKAGE